MPPRPTVLLFDIDGTLVDTGGAGRRAMERAFAAHTGSAEPLRDVPFGGMTDRAIIRAGLDAASHLADEATLDAVIARYLAVLEQELVSTVGYRIHAGVVEALDALSGRSEAVVGLGTGNVREGARLKLEKGGIAARFAFGGFGCDHEDRAKLLAVGAARGAERLGVRVEACRVVIIGDTPRDVAAAFAIGAECIAVATGSFGEVELTQTGATLVVRDLRDPAALAALLA